MSDVRAIIERIDAFLCDVTQETIDIHRNDAEIIMKYLEWALFKHSISDLDADFDY